MKKVDLDINNQIHTKMAEKTKMNQKQLYKFRMEHYNKHRYKLLLGIIKMLNTFAQPSLDPETYAKLEKILNSLKRRYKK